MSHFEKYIKSKTKKQCVICKNSTYNIDIFSEQRICSDECMQVLDSDLSQFELKFKNGVDL